MYSHRKAEVRNKTENVLDCENEDPTTAKGLGFVEKGTAQMNKRPDTNL